MHSKKIALTVFVATLVTTAWAEPTVQAGDTLESLSKVKISVSTHSTMQDQGSEKKSVTTESTPHSETVSQLVDVEAIDKPIIE
ncbi:hypothetical protein B9T29_14295 [Acinetobacter sp. ANC 3903]|uniref:hypothetical protein n=1 Tax=Acinetobacter sp. ANC 3903 TaxID=1977883 RepID=UPI000A34774B|nr:hypothetical protein [Acinetobacter sp. ANC 3903]OTG58341.1 hypothetical protein B9T29_14295 [Acinetobacter sp. ANC 3903]